uniref:Uncharacterized protein n=1 Tax=Aegilops tauschii subsp. strangulata TaxID=200361 RepID=A0A452ZJ74_AEGTS
GNLFKPFSALCRKDEQRALQNGAPCSRSHLRPLPLSASHRHGHHRWNRRRHGAVGIRGGSAQGSPVLVVLQEPPGPEGVHAHQAMADRPLAAGWPGSVGRRARQLPGGRAAQRRPEATQLDMAAQGRPHLRGQPSRRRVQLRGGRQPAGDHRPAGGGGHDHAAQGPRQGADDLAEQPAVHRRRVVRRQVRRHARRLRRPGRPRRRAQAHARRRGARRQLDLAGGFRVFVRDALVPGVEAGSQRRRPRKQVRPWLVSRTKDRLDIIF